MPSQSFPSLENFLTNIKSGIKDFGLHEIDGLLSGRKDREFLKKTKLKQQLLNEAIKEIQVKCRIRLHRPPDPLRVKSLFWEAISLAVSLKSKGNWDTDKIGESIVAQLYTPGDEHLVCIPLWGSVGPFTKEPKCYRLASGVWLIEPTGSVESLLALIEGILRRNLPQEIKAKLNQIGNPRESEYGALVLAPMIACLTKGRMDQRGYLLSKCGIPLMALDNIVAVKNLDPWDKLQLGEYVRQPSLTARDDKLASEWLSRNPDSSLFPLTSYTNAHASLHIAWYEFRPHEKDISLASASSVARQSLPPLLILPSLLDSSRTEGLIEYGQKIFQSPETDLDRRIAHAIEIWTIACSKMQEVAAVFSFEGQYGFPVMSDPDLVILYSTIVLETLFSSKSEKQEVTARIGDLTAGLLGKSGDDRYWISRKTKKAYALRSVFVHGEGERPFDYPSTVDWLFKIATLALWRTVQWAIPKSPPDRDWKQFIEIVERRKFGSSSNP